MLAAGKQCTPDAADLTSNLPVATTLQAQVSEHCLFGLRQILTTAVKKNLIYQSLELLLFQLIPSARLS